MNKISKAAAALGRKGGSVKSERKAKSSAENGKKGGRPKSLEVKYELIHPNGNMVASIRTNSLKKARDYFAGAYRGRHVIVCGDNRRNVIL